ncbi:MAG TPA: DUF1697 domain-containing protein [Bacteroidia bacterium]|nr:DUF1697 domain-containing protein [Bacteroidia bacterium]
MQTYISILRGINVGGHRKILMADLKKMYEKLNLKEIVTYIQSGNVIFKTDKKNSDEIAKAIEKIIFETCQFQVPVIIRTIPEIKKIISENPFLKEKNTEIEKLHVTFLSEIPDKSNAEAILKYDYSPDKFSLNKKEVYVFCNNGYGNTKLSNPFFENKLKVGATTRNWKTLTKLLELAE